MVGIGGLEAAGLELGSAYGMAAVVEEVVCHAVIFGELRCHFRCFLNVGI